MPRKKSVKSPKRVGINTNALCVNVRTSANDEKATIVSVGFHWCGLHEWPWIGMRGLKVEYESNVSRSLQSVELIITSGTFLITFVIARYASWDQLCCYFYRAVLPVCVIHKPKCIMHSTIRWLTFKQYVFCKDNRLVLIGECLFAKASTANAGASALEAPPSSPRATAHLH